MVNKNAERINDVVESALKDTNNRGIFLSGWDGVNKQSSNEFLYLESHRMTGCCRAVRR
ncbi:MAG: hypothetical protein U0V02_17045 [Anaerolineales bacterium]